MICYARLGIVLTDVVLLAADGAGAQGVEGVVQGEDVAVLEEQGGVAEYPGPEHEALVQELLEEAHRIICTTRVSSS